MMPREQAMHDFLKLAGQGNARLQPLAGDASFRRYVRVIAQDSTRYMLMDAPPPRENVGPFVAAAGYLRRQGFSAPEILAEDRENGFLLLEDLGDDSYTRVLAANPGREEALYRAAVDVLAAWSEQKNAGMNDLSLRHYDTAMLMDEVTLFADWFMPMALGAAAAESLRTEYLSLWQAALSAGDLACDQWVHRDYHADNLMWLPQRQDVQKVGLLDFQDGVMGDAAYDLVSLLEDARRDVPHTLAEAMIAHFLSATNLPAKAFMARYSLLGAQRNSKIIGIFVRLAVRDRKPHYLGYLPRVWAHLAHDLGHASLEPLRQWMNIHIPQAMRGIPAIELPAA